MTLGDSAADGGEPRSVAHRIRNVLHGAKLQLALLEHELQGGSVTADALQAAAAVRAHVDHVARLVAELAAEANDTRQRDGG